MKQLMTYYGGKGKLAPWIVQHMPVHTVYVEPFCGSAAVFFRKGRPPVTHSNYYRECLNDLNNNVVSIYHALRNHPDEFQRRIELMPYANAEHSRAQRIWCGKETEDNPVERAVLMLLLFMGSVGGQVYPGTMIGMGKKGCNNATTWNNRRKLVPEFIERLRSTYITNEPAIDCINRWDSPQTLFYVDPPYVDTRQGHYAGFAQADLDELLTTLAMSQGAFMLSGYANENVQAVADALGWTTHSKQAICSTDKYRSSRTELLWTRPAQAEPTTSAIKAMQAVTDLSYFCG